MVLPILVVWGCMPEVTSGCVDMTNASSTYLSITIGAIVGALISWWIYESHNKVLKSIEQFQNHQEKVLNKILNLDKKIDDIVEGKNG